MKKVLVTGEHAISSNDFEVKSLPIFNYQKLSVDLSILKPPPQWIIFTSPRSVRFFSDILIDQQEELPFETQIACIGNETAGIARFEGYEVDFFPVDAGSEGFLKEFQELLENVSEKPTVIIVQAKNGRNLLQQKLQELGCKVHCIEAYEKVIREDLKKDLEGVQLKDFDLVLFTSPSSFDAVHSIQKVSKETAIAAIGLFTSEHLKTAGYDHKILPNSDFEKIKEILC